MHDLYSTLEELCDTVTEELAEANRKLDGSSLTAGDVEYIDKLTHTLKSIKTTMAMMDKGYSEFYPNGMYGTERGSYARGRMNAPRDSRGRYSGRYSNYYSMESGEMVEDLRELMEKAPDDRIKHEFEKFIGKIESM